MRIGAKVGLLVGGLLASQVALLGVGQSILTSEANAHAQLVETATVELAFVSELNQAYLQERIAFNEMVVHSPGIVGAEAGKNFVTYRGYFEDRLASTSALIDAAPASVQNPDLVKRIAAIGELHEEITALENAQLSKVEAGTYDVNKYSTITEKNQQANAMLADAMTAATADVKSTSAARAQSSRAALAWAAAAIAGVFLLAALVITRRIVRPIRRLIASAQTSTTDTLPNTVATIRRTTGEVSAPEVPAIESGTTGDELATLADAMNSLQGRAVELAVEQRQTELNNAAMLVNLGRRNQSLLSRTLSYVGQLEREERDPKVLAQLFRLDHLATRIRRNAESMLVLAGAEQARTHAKPSSMYNVVRSALSEIEDYRRVVVSDLAPAALHGHCSAEVAHLLAELLENGTRFSPDDTTVEVTGRDSAGGYVIQVSDQGLGMPADELSEANRRICEAADHHPDSKLLGLHIVGRLAARRGITVVLRQGETRGIVAEVTLPASVLAPRAAAESTKAAPVARPAKARPAPAAQTPEPIADPAPTTQEPELAEAPLSLPVRPGRSDVEPVPAAVTAAVAAEPTSAAPAAAAPAPAASGPKRRVRGANLPDLGGAQAPDVGVRDAKSVGRQLSGLQSSVTRARNTAATERSQASEADRDRAAENLAADNLDNAH